MTGKTVRAAHEHPQADGPAPFTTLVELTFQKQKIEHWIRFGRKSYEQILDRRRSVVGFAPDSIFAFVRWAAGEHGTQAAAGRRLRRIAPLIEIQSRPSASRSTRMASARWRFSM